jgi:GNAT superfamily N-acetyltransferase
MYEFRILDPVTAPAYERLTFPMFRFQLSATQGSFAIGVQYQSQPCGLVLAEYSPDDCRSRICSLYVEPAHRRRGLGKALLDRMEQTLIDAGSVEVELHYTVNLTTPVLDRILEQLNWSPGLPFSLMCVIQRDLVQHAPWLNYPLPTSLTPFPWSELTLRDRGTIQQQRSSLLNYPPELCPFREEHLIEPQISFGLRHQGQVVGWNIVHRIAVDTVRYSALYIRPDLQPAGRAIPLLATAVRQQIKDRQVTKGIFIVLLNNASMIKFVHQRVSPYLTEIHQTWKASKILLVLS